MNRAEVLDRLSRLIAEVKAEPVARVGIDGVDGAGKTCLADELAACLAATGRPIIRASVDGFHNPKFVRYRRGRSSPEGFYRDSYDYAALKRVLLDPLSPGGSLRYRRAVFDVDEDLPVEALEEEAAAGSILLFDGIFLHRPGLRGYWEFSVLLQVEWDRNHRTRHRPPNDFGPGDPRNDRYRLGQRLYLDECRPWQWASVVLDNEVLEAPLIVSSLE